MKQNQFVLRLKIFYLLVLGGFILSIIFSPKTKQIDEVIFFLLLFSVGITLPIIPFLMLSKANSYYIKAKSEGRTRRRLERKPRIVEEDYLEDSILIIVHLIFLYLIAIFYLWK